MAFCKAGDTFPPIGWLAITSALSITLSIALATLLNVLVAWSCILNVELIVAISLPPSCTHYFFLREAVFILFFSFWYSSMKAIIKAFSFTGKLANSEGLICILWKAKYAYIVSPSFSAISFLLFLFLHLCLHRILIENLFDYLILLSHQLAIL